MSKGLEALEVSKQLKDFVLEFIKNGLDRRFIHGSFDIIETELERLEEARDMWKSIADNLKEKSDKQDEVLRIIKEKNVDIYGIKESQDVYDYNSGIENEPDFEKRLLTKKDFDLLKEVLL